MKIFITCEYHENGYRIVRAHTSEQAAKEAVEKCQQAEERYRAVVGALRSKYPGLPHICISSPKQTSEYPYGAIDGRFYSTEDVAAYQSEMYNFTSSEEGKEVMKNRTNEEFYIPCDLIET